MVTRQPITQNRKPEQKEEPEFIESTGDAGLRARKRTGRRRILLKRFRRAGG